MGSIIRYPEAAGKLRPIDRRVLDALAAHARPVTLIEIATRCDVSLDVTRSSLNRLIVMGHASRVRMAGEILDTYAARACAICGAFVADRPHTCHGETPADSFNLWHPGDFRAAVTGALGAAGLVVLVLLIVEALQ